MKNYLTVFFAYKRNTLKRILFLVINVLLREANHSARLAM